MHPHQPSAVAHMIHVKVHKAEPAPVAEPAPAYVSDDEEEQERKAVYADQMAEFQMKQDALEANAQAHLQNLPPQFFPPGPAVEGVVPAAIPQAQAEQTFRLRRKQLPSSVKK